MHTLDEHTLEDSEGVSKDPQMQVEYRVQRRNENPSKDSTSGK